MKQSTEKVSPCIYCSPQALENTFVMDRLIGQGDCGRVYLARRKADNQVFALKVLWKAELARRSKVRRAFNEYSVLTGVIHPNIVSLHAFVQTEAHLVFVLEFCARGELFYYMHTLKDHCLDADLARLVSAHVLLALKALHTNGIIYRDLKPENILLSSSGRAVLADFDLVTSGATVEYNKFASIAPMTLEAFVRTPLRSSMCQKVSGEVRDSAMYFLSKESEERTSGFYPASSSSLLPNEEVLVFSEGVPILKGNENRVSIVGTREYMSPEVVLRKPSDRMVDFWSFGCLLYELHVGQSPFAAFSPREVVDRIRKLPVRYSHRMAIPPPKAVDLIHHLLNKDASTRFGVHGGWSDIQRHPYFAGFDWTQTIPFPLLGSEEEPLIRKETEIAAAQILPLQWKSVFEDPDEYERDVQELATQRSDILEIFSRMTPFFRDREAFPLLVEEVELAAAVAARGDPVASPKPAQVGVNLLSNADDVVSIAPPTYIRPLMTPASSRLFVVYHS